MNISEEIGAKAFQFELFFSLLITIIGVGLIAGGVDPGTKARAMFLPISWLYSQVASIQGNLPQQQVSVSLVWTVIGTVLFGFVLEFMFMMLSGFLVLVYTISSIIPPSLSFLSVPLYVLGAFLQLMVWVYGIGQMLNRLASITPWGGGGGTTSG